MINEVIAKYYLASIIDSSQDSIISVDFDMNITSWNKAAEFVYGYPADQVMGKPLPSLTRDDDLKLMTERINHVKNSKRVETFQMERVGRGGKRLDLEIVLSPVKNDEGDVIGVSTIARDNSLRNLAEKALRDRELLRKVLTAQEDERGRLARDLHDEIGQEVTALRFMLKSAKEQCPDFEGRGEYEKMESVIHAIDRSVDSISWQLRPAALDLDTTLVAALNNFTRQWSRHTGIPVKLIPALGAGGEHLLSAVDTSLYRIMQEALNNIHKHAQATAVEVSLKMRDGSLILIVSDNGKGFSVKDRNTQSKGFGLIGMRERAALIDASIEIESAPRKGTTIYINVPMSSGLDL